MPEHYTNPYSNTNIFEFFGVMLMRLYGLLTGTLDVHVMDLPCLFQLYWRGGGLGGRC